MKLLMCHFSRIALTSSEIYTHNYANTTLDSENTVLIGLTQNLIFTAIQLKKRCFGKKEKKKTI